MDHHLHHHTQHPALKPSFLIPLAIVMGGVIVAVAVYVSLPKGPERGVGDTSLVRSVDSSDHILGNPVARVTIIEYSDFDCQYCKTFNETMHQLIANEGATGDVAWVFRHFPLLEIHPNALSHARAAECAAKAAGDDAFWRFETALFDNQPVDPATYGALAKTVGITGDAFAQCYANAGSVSSTVQPKILADRQNALDLGAEGTPFSVMLISGKEPVIINGNYSYEEMRRLVNEAIGN